MSEPQHPMMRQWIVEAKSDRWGENWNCGVFPQHHSLLNALDRAWRLHDDDIQYRVRNCLTGAVIECARLNV